MIQELRDQAILGWNLRRDLFLGWRQMGHYHSPGYVDFLNLPCTC